MLLNGTVGAGKICGKESINIGGICLCDGLGNVKYESLELFILCNEVSLAVYFNKYAYI